MMTKDVIADHIHVRGTHLFNSNKQMTYELTLDQLQSVRGAGTETHWNKKLQGKGTYNLKELADSGQLVEKMKYIPGEMYRFLGDMY